MGLGWVLALAALGCGPGRASTGEGGQDTQESTSEVGESSDAGSSSETSVETSGETETGEPPPCPPGGCLDGGGPPPQGPCPWGQCVALDVVFVIDGSSSMAEEQLNLAAQYPQMIDQLRTVFDDDGDPLPTDVHLMVMPVVGLNPLCPQDEEPGFRPLWQPQTDPCTERLEDFVLEGEGEAQSFEQACELSCPDPVAPLDPYIAFNSEGSNVPGDAVEQAFGCLAPQGVASCDYGSILETMLQALNPGAEWNSGPDPFLREGAALVIVVIADEPDCSLRLPEGAELFLSLDTYWPLDPETGTKPGPTQATCWSTGVHCGEPDPDGVYADCDAVDTGVLFGLERYSNYLRGELIDSLNKEVVMLGVLGVPPVTAHGSDLPNFPIEGGVSELVYRQWQDGPWPAGDMLPGSMTDAATKQYELGIGPGCTEIDEMGEVIGQGLPPVRVRELCEGLNADDRLRCCIESICDPDLSQLFNCVGPF